jgi:putative transposase
MQETPHEKKLQRFHESGQLHELTFSTYQRLPLLTKDSWLCRLSKTIDAAGVAEEVGLVAFVFMPEHVHLIIQPNKGKSSIGRYLARLKQPFSKDLKEQLIALNSSWLSQLTVRERPGKTCFRCWQEGAGYDRNLYSDKAIQRAIEYVHLNPVRRKITSNVMDWKWSSARFYLGQGEQREDDDLPKITQPWLGTSE